MDEIGIGCELVGQFRACEGCTPARLARGTTPEPAEPTEAEVALFLSHADQLVDHFACTVALHESLTALLELEALVTRLGGYLTTEQQDAVWRARSLLKRHGRR